jgi:hypothetical protein
MRRSSEGFTATIRENILFTEDGVGISDVTLILSTISDRLVQNAECTKLIYGQVRASFSVPTPICPRSTLQLWVEYSLFWRFHAEEFLVLILVHEGPASMA